MDVKEIEKIKFCMMFLTLAHASINLFDDIGNCINDVPEEVTGEEREAIVEFIKAVGALNEKARKVLNLNIQAVQ